MKTLARLLVLMFAFSAPMSVPAQQKQDTMDKKEARKKAKKKPAKRAAKKTGESSKDAVAPAPGPK